MKYPLLIISYIESSAKDRMVILTFYPTDTACIMPQKGHGLLASYIKHFAPEIELADALSEKGRRRLKIVLRQPDFDEDERRTLGSLYYSLCFGNNPGNDEYKKGGADELYKTICDLYRTDSASEDAWENACSAAVSTIQRLASQHYMHEVDAT